MADLSKINIVGPFQAEFLQLPPEQKPSECQIPAETGGPFSLDPIGAPVIPTECDYKFLNIPLIPTPFVPPSFSATVTATIDLSFRVVSADQPAHPLRVRVPGGDVTVCDQKFQIPGSGGNSPLFGAPEDDDTSDTIIELPSSTVGHKIWLEADTDGDTPPTKVEIKNSTSGWPGFPDQPTSPCTKYFLLCEATTTGSTIAEIDHKWDGGDIVWPGCCGGTTTSGPVECPFDLVLEDNGDGSSDLNIRPGSVNQMIPTGLLATTTLSNSGSHFVKIACLTDGKSLTSCSLEVDGSSPDANVANAAAGTSTLDICVGVVVSGVAFKTLGFCGSISVVLQQVFLEDKPSPSIGESPYNRWYQWGIGAG